MSAMLGQCYGNYGNITVMSGQQYKHGSSDEDAKDVTWEGIPTFPQISPPHYTDVTLMIHPEITLRSQKGCARRRFRTAGAIFFDGDGD